MSKRTRYINSCQVLDAKEYTLQGYPQKVFYEGRHRESPVILYLHGGPGSPVPFCAGSRGLFPEVTERFIMVYWDQLGCGINDHVIDDSFSVDDYVSMTVDLLYAIREDFPENKINLFGVSWGSILAARAAEKVPELINKAAVYGQVTKNLFFNSEVLEALNAAAISGKHKALLKELASRREHGTKDIKDMAGLIRRYTEGYQAKGGGKTPMAKILWGLLTSPDYSFKNFMSVAVNGTTKNNSLYKEIVSLDITDVLARVKIPYLILQGETDIVTSTKFIRDFVNTAANGNLTLSVLPRSGHMPGGDAMKKIIESGFSFFL
ncbi:MAG: alpha/beta hydrolase [Lachnospiraceae bacterium]|nr:alpha/beta hydrolase [Ruminococcus sp.]MCM1275888.1 alpha/beta hydrolase [Lachnospiraceae bacterium]